MSTMPPCLNVNTGVQRHREAAVSESGVSAGKVQDASRRRAHIPPALSVSTDSGPSAPDCSWAELKGSALSVTFSLFIWNGRTWENGATFWGRDSHKKEGQIRTDAPLLGSQF